MKPSRSGPINPATAVAAASERSPALIHAQGELSKLEEQWVSRNGNSSRTESGLKARQDLAKMEEQIAHLEKAMGVDEPVRHQLHDLRQRMDAVRRQVAVHLNAWEKAELARHPQRPHMLDYVERIFTDWSEIHGDRAFGDDPAMVCGMARLQGKEVVVLGTQKGRDMKQRVYRNFGLPNPEGYRKALRVMKIAEKFSRPLITLVDVTGANPGVGAEERGQAEAIARNLREMARLRVPIVTAITGEGGSGGALAIAVADRVLMMENAVYSVISPEGCASIMWRDASKKDLAAEALKITATDLSGFGIIDGVVAEPEGGAHSDPQGAADLLGRALREHLAELEAVPVAELVASRYTKFRNMAQFYRITV